MPAPGTPVPGGWAWAVPGGRFASGCAAHTTNQRMEISAAFEAVQAIEGRLEVVSDSTYVVNCFRDRWHEGWLKRGWKNSSRQPVANRDLWEPFIELVLGRGDVTFRWVKGHNGDPMNDLVDRLAVEAAVTQEGRTGEGEPDGPRAGGRDPGPIAAAARDRRLPDGPARAGRRPPTRRSSGGYDANPVADGVATRLRETLAAMVEVDGELTVVSGLRLGAEQLGAEAAVALGLPLVAVLPVSRRPTSPGRPTPRAGSPSWSARPSPSITLESEGARQQAAGRRGTRSPRRLAGQAGGQRGGGVGPRGRRRGPRGPLAGGPPRARPGAPRAPLIATCRGGPGAPCRPR